jgi:excisionase family DNA binding protein
MRELTFNELPQAISELFKKMESIETLLINNSNNTQADPEQLLNIKQAGELLNLSVPTLYGYVHRAEIPVSKRGKRLYFSKQELLDWIKLGRKKTVSEIKAEALANFKKTK